jgi:uncharacterized membrane protein
MMKMTMRTDKALQESRRFGVKPVPVLRPLGWLARGWQDLLRCPGPSLLHGLMMTLGGAVIAWFARDRFWLLAAAFSGFLLVAPILATGLYALSRAIERNESPSLKTVLIAWRPHNGRLMGFGLLLALAGTGWVLCSAALITGYASAPVDKPLDFVRHVVLAEHSLLFEAWLALGALLAAPVFASTVIALPMLLDRREQSLSILGAVFTSWRVVMEHPQAMALWAFLLMGLTGLGMLTMIGLIVVLPWLGHSSWHAYRDLVSMRD